MSFIARYVDDGAGIIYTARDCLTREDILPSSPRTRSLEEEAKLRYVLVDHTALDEVALSAEDIRDLALENENAPSSRSQRLIVVAAPTDHIFGISRMWQALVERLGWSVQIFRTRAEAEACITQHFPEARLEPSAQAE